MSSVTSSPIATSSMSRRARRPSVSAPECPASSRGSHSSYIETVDELVRQNFGPGESIWNPKCFDRLYTIREGSKVVALCTLQKWGDRWILGDLCVAEKRRGLGTRLVNKVISKVKEPIWVDANAESHGIFAKDPRWRRTAEAPWHPSGTAWLLETTSA